MSGWQRYRRDRLLAKGRRREGRRLMQEALARIEDERDREMVGVYYLAIHRVDAADPETWLHCLERMEARPAPPVPRVRHLQPRLARLCRGGRRP